MAAIREILELELELELILASLRIAPCTSSKEAKKQASKEDSYSSYILSLRIPWRGRWMVVTVTEAAWTSIARLGKPGDACDEANFSIYAFASRCIRNFLIWEKLRHCSGGPGQRELQLTFPTFPLGCLAHEDTWLSCYRPLRVNSPPSYLPSVYRLLTGNGLLMSSRLGSLSVRVM
jgi:hypothetical protein